MTHTRRLAHDGGSSLLVTQGRSPTVCRVRAWRGRKSRSTMHDGAPNGEAQDSRLSHPSITRSHDARWPPCSRGLLRTAGAESREDVGGSCRLLQAEHEGLPLHRRGPQQVQDLDRPRAIDVDREDLGAQGCRPQRRAAQARLRPERPRQRRVARRTPRDRGAECNGEVLVAMQRRGKGSVRVVRCETGKTSASERLMKCREGGSDIETGASMQSRDEAGGCPLIGQPVSGMQAGQRPLADADEHHRARIAADSVSPRRVSTARTNPKESRSFSWSRLSCGGGRARRRTGCPSR